MTLAHGAFGFAACLVSVVSLVWVLRKTARLPAPSPQASASSRDELVQLAFMRAVAPWTCMAVIAGQFAVTCFFMVAGVPWTADLSWVFTAAHVTGAGITLLGALMAHALRASVENEAPRFTRASR